MTPQAEESREAYVSLTELVSYLDGYLNSAGFQDYGPNGLQIDGRPQIRRLITGVSSCRELFSRAEALRADSILVHHGLFWNNLPAQLTGIQYQRVARLVRSNTSLIAYHLPLDAHSEVGNNVLAARRLELADLTPFGQAHGVPIGFRGRLQSPISANDLVDKCARLFGQQPVHLGNHSSSAQIKTVAVVSGAGQDFLHEAIAGGIDAFVTGEATEWVTNLSKEAGLCFIAAGHYATERLGVRALGEHLATRFGIVVEFVDVPNPV